MLDSGRLDEGAARIKLLVAKNPDAAWPRLALGALYYRKYWRRDAIKQWQLALGDDPEIREDPQFGAYLCFMLDDAWKTSGMTDLLNQLGAQAVPLLDHCVVSAKDPSAPLIGITRDRSPPSALTRMSIRCWTRSAHKRRDRVQCDRGRDGIGLWSGVA